MKKMKFRLNMVLVILTFTIFASCLDSGFETPPPTEQEEQLILNAYLDNLHSEGFDVDTTSLGIYYVTLETGEGDFPAIGDSLEVGYAAYFTDGKLFDASDLYKENGTFEFILGETPMIEGWNNGMSVINKNAKVQLIIPSKFAYGSAGAGIIPPYKTLIFVVEMLEIKPS